MGLGKACLVVFLAAVVAFAAFLIPRLGVGRVVWDHQPGDCHVLEGIENGSEDMEVLPDDIALITSGLKFSAKLRKHIPAHVKGQIFWFDFKSPDKPPKPVTIFGKLDLDNFNPHGISSWRDLKGGVTSIYVVNHPLDQDQDHDRVEKFTWQGSSKVLTHVRSISDPAFRLTNDLKVVGDDQFYISNHMYYRHDLVKALETFTFRSWGEVLYFDGERGRVVADGIQGTNGLELSLDKRFLYVAASLSENIHVYNRLGNNSLELRNVISVGSAPDNIHVDLSGDMWLGTHPVAWKVVLHLEEGKYPAPSQVLRLKMNEGYATQTEEVFADSGRHIYGSTIAAYRRGGVLIGTIMHKAMYCQVAYLS